MKHGTIREDLLADVVSRLPDNGLRTMRAGALRTFLQTGLPGTSHEDWRYTSLQPAIAVGNAWLRRVADGEAGSVELDEHFDSQACEKHIDASWLRFLNGRITGSTGLDDRVPGIEIRTLSSGNGRHKGDIDLDTTDPLSSFNAALLVDATRIRVADNATVGRPLGMLFANKAAADGSLSSCRILIEVGRNARIDFVESHVSLAESASFSNLVIELRLDSGACVNFLRLQDCSESAIETVKLIASIGDSATLNYCSVDVGGSLVRNDVSVSMGNPGASFNGTGLYLSGARQHIDNHVRVDHKVGPARSDTEFRGILHGKSRCVFNSKAVVHAGADGTDARQSNHNLLLSTQAEIDTKPELEIYADEVEASHGATVGQLDEQAVFYLRCRGLSEESARRMLTAGFCRAVTDRMENRLLAEWCEKLLDSAMQETEETPGALK